MTTEIKLACFADPLSSFLTSSRMVRISASYYECPCSNSGPETGGTCGFP
jgi:hypothetical protein